MQRLGRKIFPLSYHVDKCLLLGQAAEVKKIPKNDGDYRVRETGNGAFHDVVHGLHQGIFLH
jgi:hypothetical protein